MNELSNSLYCLHHIVGECQELTDELLTEGVQVSQADRDQIEAEVNAMRIIANRLYVRLNRSFVCR